MFLCLCGAVSEKKIRLLVKEGYSAKEIRSLCKVGQCCGKCSLRFRELTHVNMKD